jgi:hypothetical protein
MLGKDFYIFWQFGQAILSGQDFYSSPEALYPPAMLFFFIPLAIFPFQIAYAFWTGLSFILFYIASKKTTSTVPWIWFLFSPTVFILMTGQIDIIFFWLSTFLNDDQSWKKILAATLITLKPQLAFVLLPWWLFQWIKTSPKMIVTWLLACAGLHGFPLLLDINIYDKWLNSLSNYTESRIVLSPGLFSFTSLNVPIWLISLIILPIFILGFKNSFFQSKAANLLALPMGIWYDSILLTASTSPKILIPVSWAAFILAVVTKSSIPFLSIPLLVFILGIKINHAMPNQN